MQQCEKCPAAETEGLLSPSSDGSLLDDTLDAMVEFMALLLTGQPGVGKTSVLRATAGKLAGFHLVGFYTEEIRTGRERRGFRLVTFSGEAAIIAHIDLPPPRVSKYGVNVAVIDRFAATLQDRRDRSGNLPDR